MLTLTRPGGLLGRVTRRALEGELDAHMGYAGPDRGGPGRREHPNGQRAKTVITDVGAVELP